MTLRRASLGLVAALVAVTQLGCRIYTLPPESAARLNDDHWTIEHDDTAPAPPANEAPPVVVPLVPLRQRPEVTAAMQTPRDAFGIPAGLYAVDPLLMAHRHEVDVRARNASASARTFFIAAAIWGAVTVALVATAPVVARHAESPEAARTLFYLWGGITGIEALGSAGVALSQHADTSALERYYRETYGR